MPRAWPAELQALTDDLNASYQRAWSVVVVEQQRVAAGIVANPRLWRQRDRLAEVRARIESEMAHVDAIAEGWLAREFPQFYLAGAERAATELASPFGWTQTHKDALVLLARDTHDDLLAATRFVRDDTKRFIRQVARDVNLTDQLVGRTARQTAARMTDYLNRQGITSVVYANGARVGLDTYAEMAVRTKTAVAYNVGTLNQGAEAQVKFYEVFDGPSCGWSAHNDPELANGMIVGVEDAQAFIIAHPNCARSFGPRPDLTTKTQAKKAEPTAGGQAADRPEAAQLPLEAAARTKAAREAASGNRAAAGLMGRPRTPQAVLARRQALLQKVRLPRTPTLPTGPPRGAPPAPAPPAPPPGWRAELDQLLADRPTFVIGSEAQEMTAQGFAPNAASVAQEEWVRQVGGVVDREVMRRAEDKAVQIAARVDAPALRQELTRLAQQMDAMDTGWDAAAQDLFGRKWAELKTAEERQAAIVRGRELSAERDKLRQARLAIRRQLVEVEHAHALGYREAAREVLGEVREMGTGQKGSWRWVDSKVKRQGAKAAEAKAELEAASKFFPKDFVDRANASRGIRTGMIKRGHQLDHAFAGYTDVLLSAGREGVLFATDSDLLSVATHELSHLMETTDARIRALEHAFHYRRTAGASEPLSTIYKGTSEVGRRDLWSEHYMGKVYGTRGAAEYWEHFSMGMEGIWTGRWKMVDVDVGDADYRAWVLGILAGL